MDQIKKKVTNNKSVMTIIQIIKILYTILVNVITILYLLNPTPTKRIIYVTIVTINIIIRVVINYYKQINAIHKGQGNLNEKRDENK
jgi:hypothetical protein